jgi:small subunit ribosomal protein S20
VSGLHQQGETKLANTRSAIKRIRSNERKRVNNKVVRTSVRTQLRNANETLEGTDAAAAHKAALEAISALDKAANKGVLHKRNAARRKSRLMKKIAAVAKK